MKKSRRTQEELSRNLTGFEGDSYIEEEIKKLVHKFEINTIIETGTFLGGTTQKLAQLANQVYTIEVDSEIFLKLQNISKIQLMLLFWRAVVQNF